MSPSKTLPLISCLALLATALPTGAQTGGAGEPYKLIRSDKVGGVGGWDYVYADADARRLYVPRGDRITV